MIVENPKPLTDLLSLQLFERDDAKKNAALSKLPYLNTLDDIRRSRLSQLLDGLTRRWSLTHQYSVSDTIMLLEHPPIFTSKEITDLFAQFKAARQERRLALVKAWITTKEGVDHEKSYGLFVGMVALRENLFSSVIDYELEEDITLGINDVNRATDLIQILVKDLKLFATNVLTAQAWSKLFTHLAQWSAWRKPEYYIPIRDSELHLLQEATSGLSEDLQTQILEAIPVRPHHTQKTSPEFQKVLKDISDHLEKTVCYRILSRFSREDGVDAFWKDDSSIERKYAFDPMCAFHKPPFRDSLLSLAKSASENTTVQKNFLTYFRMLAHGAIEPSSFPREN